jgi:ASC-1-like (ASCH) protein
MEIKKKIWPKYFQEILENKKKFEVRLADFEIKQGDILVLEEYNPETKEYTGRTIKKKVNFITKFNPAECYGLEDIKKYGFWEIELE